MMSLHFRAAERTLETLNEIRIAERAAGGLGAAQSGEGRVIVGARAWVQPKVTFARPFQEAVLQRSPSTCELILNGTCGHVSQMLVADKVVLAFAVVAGTASATILARDVWGVDLHPVLDGSLEVYDKWVNRRLWTPVDAAPYWAHVFMLLWLVFASYAWPVSRSRPLPRAVFAWICGFAFALLGGVLAGRAPPFPNVVLWPLVSIAAFFVLQALYELIFRSQK